MGVPNPSSDYFNISLSSKGDAEAVLYDMKGVALGKAKLIKGLGILSTDNLPSGMYLVRVSDGRDFTATEKVFILR